MSKYDLILDVEGLRDFAKRLRATEKEIEDIASSGGLRTALEHVKSRQERRWIINFNSSGAEYGVNWSGIHDSTLDWRSNMGGSTSTKPLVDTGHSYGMLRSFMDENSDMMVRVGGGWVEWNFTDKGTSDFPLPFHHFGYTTPNAFGVKGLVREVTARPIWLMDNKDEENSFRTFSRWAHKAIRELSIFG